MNDRFSIGSTALVFGFGTALSMWIAGFLARLDPALVPSGLVLAALVACLLGGGAAAGRVPGGGARAGAAVGLVASLVNLLVLGSLLSGDRPNALVPSALLWLPGSLALGAIVGGAGGWIGRRLRPLAAEPDWNATLARVAVVATLALVAIGGLVTSHDAGLAVVDWPNSYGYNMFLYPLARMVGGVYYEHVHRLFGSLVGLTTLALFVRLLVTERRGGVRAAGAVALLLVIGQGVLGGLRVTGHFTLAADPDLTRPSLGLAMLHGVTGQLFFAWMVALAALTSRTWKERTGAVPAAGAGADHAISAILVAGLLLQLALGVRLRHTGEGAMIHITFAVVVLILTLVAAVRVMGSHSGVAVLRRTSGALITIGATQLVIGGVAFLLVNRRGGEGVAPPAEVLVATLHQTLGAILLGCAVLLAVWTRRLLVEPERAAIPVPRASAS